MLKKIILIAIIFGFFLIGMFFIIDLKNEQQLQEDNFDIVKNETKISSRYVTDNCINEWKDYSLTVQEEIQEASQSINDQNRHYILKAENDLIYVYYINEKGEEILYKVTDISTKYLAKEDILELEKGIDVIGIQELNKLLEDFE